MGNYNRRILKVAKKRREILNYGRIVLLLVNPEGSRG
jgi:hypothetical protein